MPFGFLYTQFCNVQTSTVCIRGTPLPGDALGPLQFINTTFINIGEQSANGIDLGGYFGFDIAGGSLSLGVSYSHLLEFQRVELNATGTSFVRRELAGEYEYPEDRATFTADWGNDKWGLYTNIAWIGPFQDTLMPTSTARWTTTRMTRAWSGTSPL